MAGVGFSRFAVLSFLMVAVLAGFVCVFFPLLRSFLLGIPTQMAWGKGQSVAARCGRPVNSGLAGRRTFFRPQRSLVTM